ncbi:sensor histidine kinase [Aquimarina aggregata]|uniref:sensor histidine kinase n=1 Tax=Aquimarina aggregata TaxID=1642818 RepID=UPI002492631F|nr:ATP-binding protein [Aquimarina aggregata]
MVTVLSIIIGFIFAIYRVFILRMLEEKNQQHQKEITHQKEIAKQYTIIQENERKRIAETLHDEVGSKLNILSLWINNDDTWNNPRSKEIIAQQIPQLINATRNVSHSLYPVNLEKFGLLLTLEELITNIDSSILVRLIVPYNYNKRSISFEVELYRIIQEFLANVIKHAKASQMHIQIRDTKKSLTIILSDNGIGFNNDRPLKGMGLKNITSRIQSIKASHKWKSIKNKGTTLIILHLK